MRFRFFGSGFRGWAESRAREGVEVLAVRRVTAEPGSLVRACLDELLEKSCRFALSGAQAFGMPLNRNDEALLGRLEPFEHVVFRRIGRGHEDGSEPLDGLVMERVDAELRTRPFGNPSTRNRPNFVHEKGFGIASRVTLGRKTEL